MTCPMVKKVYSFCIALKQNCLYTLKISKIRWKNFYCHSFSFLRPYILHFVFFRIPLIFFVKVMGALKVSLFYV